LGVLNELVLVVLADTKPSICRTKLPTVPQSTSREREREHKSSL
jgi:hypothetical protein